MERKKESWKTYSNDFVTKLSKQSSGFFCHDCMTLGLKRIAET